MGFSFSILQVSYLLSMVRRSKMVRQRGTPIYRIELHHSSDGATEYTAGQPRETFSL